MEPVEQVFIESPERRVAEARIASDLEGGKVTKWLPFVYFVPLVVLPLR